MHFNAVTESINMSLCTYLLPSEPNGEIQSLYKWFPDEKQWWITGFDYSKHSEHCDDFYNKPETKISDSMIFDTENKFVWLIW